MTGSRRVLVTGARGFLGAYCVPLLAARGFDVVAVTSAPPPPDASGLRWRRCDLLDPTACAALVAVERPTHLLHLAWITAPGVFWSARENMAWLAAGVRLADAFFAATGERAVGLGSCAEYAVSDAPCVEGGTPIEPQTVYGKAKAAMHLALQAAAGARGGSLAWARLFFPYGPGEAAGRFIPDVIRGLRQGEAVACTHGRQVRDFVFAADAAAACVALLEAKQSGAYNVGSGEGVSLREVADLLARKLGADAGLLKFGARKAPSFDPPRIVADIARIRRDTAWAPQVALSDGLARSIEPQRARAPAPTATVQNVPGATG
jgi:nucleoside-diphosphate-sugar epimerase